MVNFRELVSAALSLSAAGRHKNALGAVLLAHCVMADPAPAPAPATDVTNIQLPIRKQ